MTTDMETPVQLSAENGVDMKSFPGVQVAPIDDNSPSQEDIDFWTKHCLGVFTSLLQSTNTYTAEEQASHIEFFKNYIIPYIGPKPASRDAAYLLTHNASPFEASVNFSGEHGKSILRFTFEPQGPLGEACISDPLTLSLSPNGNSPITTGSQNQNRNPLPGLLTQTTSPDLRWFTQFSRTFWLNPSEESTVKTLLPPSISRIPRVLLAFDLVGPNRYLKAYFAPLFKLMGTTQLDPTAVNEHYAPVLSLMKTLDPLGPQLSGPLSVIEAFRAEHPDPLPLQMVAVDCIDPEGNQGARVKIYTRTTDNSFRNIRDIVTLGGRRNGDPIVMEGLEVLGKVWPFLLGGGEEEEEGKNDDTVRKEPVRDAKDLHAQIMVAWEVTAGKELPEVKVYVPLNYYATTNGVITESFGRVFREWGWSWGEEERGYKDVVLGAFGDKMISNDTETPIVHTYASFQFSKKGKYMSSYMAPPLATSF